MTGIVYLFSTIVAFFCILAPELMWDLKYGWRYKDAEASEEAIVFTRICGVLTLIIIMILTFNGVKISGR